MIIPVK